MNKRELRTQFQALRRGMDAELHEKYSRAIAQKVLNLVEQTGARSVFAYLSFAGEVDTHALIKELFHRGVEVSVPRCNKETHTMEAIALTSMEQLRTGTYGILEPQGGDVVSPECIDMVLVPALAFDQEGFRLGWGAGYYDRYLDGYQGLTVGLCFSLCQTEKLPRDDHDLPVTMVLNECEEG